MVSSLDICSFFISTSKLNLGVSSWIDHDARPERAEVLTYMISITQPVAEQIDRDLEGVIWTVRSQSLYLS